MDRTGGPNVVELLRSVQRQLGLGQPITNGADPLNPGLPGAGDELCGGSTAVLPFLRSLGDGGAR